MICISSHIKVRVRERKMFKPTKFHEQFWSHLFTTWCHIFHVATESLKHQIPEIQERGASNQVPSISRSWTPHAIGSVIIIPTTKPHLVQLSVMFTWNIPGKTAYPLLPYNIHSHYQCNIQLAGSFTLGDTIHSTLVKQAQLPDTHFILPNNYWTISDSKL